MSRDQIPGWPTLRILEVGPITWLVTPRDKSLDLSSFPMKNPIFQQSIVNISGSLKFKFLKFCNVHLRLNDPASGFDNHAEAGSFSPCPSTLTPISNGNFYTPVFRQDVLLYGDVCPSVRRGLRPSVTVFRSFLLHALTYRYWADFACHFLLMNIRSSSSFFNFHQFLLELCHFWNLKYWKYTVFRSFLLHALT